MSALNQQTLSESGANERPPMLEKGNYIPWESRISSISIGSSDVQPSESPYLPVLFIRTSQSRQHDKSESISYYLTD
ncbi:hypothetical protein Tco_1561416 [Tanacetum coccineum]